MVIRYYFHFLPILIMVSGVQNLQSQQSASQGLAYPRENKSMRSIHHVENSVLSTGDWYRIGVDKTGIYKITYDDLVAMGIDPGVTDPRNIRIYGNGNGMLAESNAVSRPDDLIENAIQVIGEEDGSFDPQDYVLFYGQSPVTWKFNDFYQLFEHEVNLYTDQTYYFLTTSMGPGKRITTTAPPSGTTTLEVDQYTDYAFHETDEINVIKSGKQWFGEIFSNITSYDFLFSFPDLVTSESVTLKTNLAARSTEDSHFTITGDGEDIINLEIPAIILGSSVYARSVIPNPAEFVPDDTAINVRFSYDMPTVTSVGWLNYIELNTRCYLRFHGGQLNFRDPNSVGPGNISEFNINTDLPELNIWDVTSPSNITHPEIILNRDGYTLKVITDSLHEFIAFNGSLYLKPLFIEKVKNQNLHSLKAADLVIVAHPLFLEQANRLADFHLQNDGLSVIVVTPQQIYNEFSSGAQDVSAIRDFMRMLYDQAMVGQKPRYLLLFGDGSFDYKSRVSNNTNFVPTFESKESLKLAASFVTDDFFGCFDLNEGGNANGNMDVGVGRIPVQTKEQAKGVVDKIIHYSLNSRNSVGDWRNRICFVADDQDGNIHLDQAEELAKLVDTLRPDYNCQKIYLDAYTQLNTTSGPRYPDVNKAIDKAVREGALIVNYTGHGGEVGWADERVLDVPTINGWNNLDEMPVFVTATCEFSRFDDASLVSAGELVILNQTGGGIALFTTTRLAYSQSNFGLNRRFYEAAFELDTATGEYPRLGDLIRLAKTPSSQNIKNFVLLGDPALMIAYPQLRVSTDSVTDEQSLKIDTLNALSKITITGMVTDASGEKAEGFSGILDAIIFDKPVKYQTLGNDATSRITDFYIQNKILYKFQAIVNQGDFSFTFIMPKDITYQFGLGKISYYAYDTITFKDAQGSTFIWIGGANDHADADNTGPGIELYLNNKDFRTGDITTTDPVMLAYLQDASGINFVGNGIGHDIIAILDGNSANPIVLNDYYVADFNSYEKGSIRYPLGTLEQGQHTLSLRAWDVYNNSSEVTIEFLIDTDAQLTLTAVYNYPNPFTTGTNFIFYHNKPGQDLNVIIQIFNMNGQFINELHAKLNTEMLKAGPFYWNGRDSRGNYVPPGLYVYVLRVISGDGSVSQQSQKMLIVR